jgi:hypothetical protein
MTMTLMMVAVAMTLKMKLACDAYAVQAHPKVQPYKLHYQPAP